jgi:hypothetical protein
MNDQRAVCCTTLNRIRGAAAQSQAAALQVELDEANRNIALYKELHKAGNVCAKQAAAMAGLLAKARAKMRGAVEPDDVALNDEIDAALAAWKGNTK